MDVCSWMVSLSRRAMCPYVVHDLESGLAVDMLVSWDSANVGLWLVVCT